MRELIIVRHGIAEDRDEAASRGVSDAERGLTEKGRARMQQAAGGLARVLADPAVIAHSPLRRARETAVLLAKAFGGVPLEELEALAPGALEPALEPALCRWLESQPEGVLAVAVGHEPDLGDWTLRALAGPNPRGTLSFRKGGAARLVFPGPCAPGEAELDWFLPPKVLRALG